MREVICANDAVGHTFADNSRCHRLNKECQHPPPVQKRRINKVARATKTAQLEQKLDGIVSLLRSQSHSNVAITDALTQSPGSILDSTSSQPDGSVHYTPGSNTDGGQSDGKATNQTNPDPAVEQISEAYSTGDISKHPPVFEKGCPYPGLGSTSSSEGSNSIEFSPVVKAALTMEDEALEIFRSQMLRTFPILVIPESMTAQQLRQDRPFLWLCIVAVSSKSSAQQLALGREVRRNIGQKLVLEGEKTLDLLLGLLVYLAWYATRKSMSDRVRL